MTKRTKPDSNQNDIEEAINLCPGWRFIDTHNVPYNLPELIGFPDGLAINENGLTIVCDDPIAVREALRGVPGIVSVIDGGIIPVEIKTEQGELRRSQEIWAKTYGVEQSLLRTIDEVFKLLGRPR